jgi:hypothetical protein
MKYAMTGIAAAAALAVVALTPAAAEAGWRGGYWGGGWVLASASISARVPIIGITPTGTVPYYYDRYSYGYGPRWKHRYRYYD